MCATAGWQRILLSARNLEEFVGARVRGLGWSTRPSQRRTAGVDRPGGSGRLCGPEEGPKPPLQRLKHLKFQVGSSVGRHLPVVDVREHRRQQLLVGHKLDILGSHVDAGQVDCRQPAEVRTALSVNKIHVKTAWSINTCRFWHASKCTWHVAVDEATTAAALTHFQADRHGPHSKRNP